MNVSIQASEFKIKCLQLLEEVQKGNTYLITKRGIPLAKLEALPQKPKKTFGSMKNSCVLIGDIIDPVDTIWESQHD